MRPAVAMLMAAWLVPVVAVAQDWTAYRYPDSGVAFQLPVPPIVEQRTYKSPDGMSLPMTRYEARQDGMVYTLDIADFSNTSADAMSTIAATEKSFGMSGTVTVAIDARISRDYGRELSVNGADGSRSAIAIFFVNKHLFILNGKSLPPNAIARSGNAVRFQQSLQFIGDYGGFGGFRRF